MEERLRFVAYLLDGEGMSDAYPAKGEAGDDLLCRGGIIITKLTKNYQVSGKSRI